MLASTIQAARSGSPQLMDAESPSKGESGGIITSGTPVAVASASVFSEGVVNGAVLDVAAPAEEEAREEETSEREDHNVAAASTSDDREADVPDTEGLGGGGGRPPAAQSLGP